MISRTQTFSENTFIALKILTLIFAAIFVFFSALIWTGVLVMSPGANGKGFSAKEFLLMFFLAELGGLLIAFLAISFTPNRKVVCNSEGCEIWIGNFWNRNENFDCFKWNDVTETEFVEEFLGSLTGSAKYRLIAVSFKILTNQKSYRLLTLKRSKKKTIDELVKFVNEATPHLKYVWEKPSDFGNRQVIVEANNYCKVART